MKLLRFIETIQAGGFDVYQVSFQLKITDFFPTQVFSDRPRPQLLPMDKGVLNIKHILNFFLYPYSLFLIIILNLQLTPTLPFDRQ